MWIATSKHSRDLDRRATQDYGVPAMVLMERAGLAVFAAVKELLPDGGHLSVFCGHGNNGGDGFVVARHAVEQGYCVDCLVAAEESELSPDAATQLSVARAQGVHPIFWGDPRWERKAEAVACSNLIVDALLGTGAKGEVRGVIQEAIRAINWSGVPVVSVDIPSGIDADTGEELGESVWALRTVTFGLPKPFLFQGIGLEHAGYWTVADIGLPSALLTEPTDAHLIEQAWVAELLPERLRASHKGENGHILIVAGSNRMPGAATMAANSAIRAGAGLVTVAGVAEVCRAVAANLPEAMLLPLPDDNGHISADAAKTILSHNSRFDAALFGPGLTHEASTLEFLSEVWQNWDIPSCIDADALNALSCGVKLPSGPSVMTPHPGELSRLLKSSIAEIQANRFEAIRSAVAEFGKTIVLKGPYSIVAELNEPLAVNCTGNPGMASGGMGDVLGGMIATLLAQDLPPYCAAACAAYWHGLAGDLCADEIGCIGYRASDVAMALPRARAKLTAACCSKLRERH